MKKLYCLMMMLLLCGSMMAQDIKVTFTGRDARDWYVKLDKVEITNLTRDWSDELVYPDTILELQNHTGVNNFPTQEFALSQNVPNPFEGATDFTLSLPANDKVNISVYDINGKKVTSLQRQLTAGVHVFRVLLSTPQTYLLNAKTSSDKASIKMINTGRGVQNQITYLGESGQPMSYELKVKGDHVFVMGDNMQYIGYATIAGEVYVDTITQVQQGPEEVVFRFTYKAPIDFEPCPYNETIKDIEGNEYPTIWYGGQCWMAENLRTTRFADGTQIEQRYTTSTQNAYYFDPNRDTANVALYGRLYNYYAVSNNIDYLKVNPLDTALGLQGPCPDGWHVPSEKEWTQMLNYLNGFERFRCDGMEYQIAKALADTIGWKESEDNCTVGYERAGNNAAGFNARPAGVLFTSAYPFLEAGSWWSSTFDRSQNKVIGMLMSSTGTRPGINAYWRDAGMAIRCVMGDGYTIPMPMVTTGEVTDVDYRTATVSATVADTAGKEILATGFCYSEYYISPNINSSRAQVEIVDGKMVAHLEKLKPNTKYYVRAFAAVNGGVAYGKVVEFTTKEYTDGKPCKGHETVTDYEGNIYNTVEIGGVCWTKENMRTKHYADGTEIQYQCNSNTAIPYYYYPNNDSTNKAKYGLLYSWYAVVARNSVSSSDTVQGICPNGWHVPSSDEFYDMRNYVESQNKYLCNSYNYGRALASQWGWQQSSANECVVGYDTLLNDATGFSWVPAGKAHSNGEFGTDGYLWLANAAAYKLNYAQAYCSSVYSTSTYTCYSVRCVLGEGTVTSTPEVVIDSVSAVNTSNKSVTVYCTLKNPGGEYASVGVCWGKDPNPVIYGYGTNWSGGSSEADYHFQAEATNLNSGTTYYLRAFGKNTAHKGYSEQIEINIP
ncbi:MAG: T9SS type A sorting domain-containing protein [Bacteroidales bacterium]|nr:T9SS type A sorting domain-containing protein [Bacteroidales bacterium]